MAHHQHHGPEYEAQVSRTLASRPSATALPSITEDEQVAEADEPPDRVITGFSKTMPGPLSRRQSLLSKAFHTDSDTHEDDLEHFEPAGINREHSISSTTSTYSNRSFPDFTSDDGHASTGTRASTPSSPRSIATYMKPTNNNNNITKSAIKLQLNGKEDISAQNTPRQASPNTEPSVEAGLGRKRAITFACGASKNADPPKPVLETPKPTEPPKRPCALKFLCPGRAATVDNGPGHAGPQRTSRRLSPAPLVTGTASPRTASRRSHRGSDATIKLESPKALRRRPQSRGRRLTLEDDDLHMESTSFHEFASSEEEVEDWVQENTCHRSRLTVDDTLKKENRLRELAEEAEEEEEIERAQGDEELGDVYDSPDELSDDEVSDTGFQTDDEDGFAESDDDSDCDSDYEWWAPRKTMAASPFVKAPLRMRAQRTGSDSSLNSTASPTRRNTKLKSTRPLDIRPPTPDLPDSTDFVCGTLDEDRPLEEEFKHIVAQKKAAKHHIIPQDIDPTFPTSDPEADTDEEDEDEDDVGPGAVESVGNSFLHGKMEPADDTVGRPKGHWRSPRLSPSRVKTPPPPSGKRTLAKSPCPRGLFNHSPKRARSPAPPSRLESPPPSPRSSGSRTVKRTETNICQAFGTTSALGPVFTASLPKSPGPMNRRASNAVSREQDEEADSDETQTEQTYTRSAIDIVQGLEQKRLRRRQKFYERYCKLAGKKDKSKREKRPQPGKGADRMRQVGLECAVYRGKRVLSV